MIMYDDTGLNAQESKSTLMAQQEQLLAGIRPAQMFPVGTKELPLLNGFERVVTKRGVFHFNPALVSREEVEWLSEIKRENLLLNLGPFNKDDVLSWANVGEPILAVTERKKDGTEVRTAVGTPSTIYHQLSTFEKTKTDGNVCGIENFATVVKERLTNVR